MPSIEKLFYIVMSLIKGWEESPYVYHNKVVIFENFIKQVIFFLS